MSQQTTNNKWALVCHAHRVAFLKTLHQALGAAATKYPKFDTRKANTRYWQYDFGCAYLEISPQTVIRPQTCVNIVCSVRDFQTSGVIARFRMYALSEELEAFAPWTAQAVLIYHRRGFWENIKEIPSTTDANPMTFRDEMLTAYTSAASAALARVVLSSML